jgi:hypothetical protein
MPGRFRNARALLALKPRQRAIIRASQYSEPLSGIMLPFGVIRSGANYTKVFLFRTAYPEYDGPATVSQTHFMFMNFLSIKEENNAETFCGGSFDSSVAFSIC